MFSKLFFISIAAILCQLFVLLQADYNPCDSSFILIDALARGQRDGELLIFRRDYFWTFDVSSRKIHEKRRIHDYWPHVETPVSARHEYWMYRNEHLLTINSTLVHTGAVALENGERVKALQFMFNASNPTLGLYAFLCDSMNRRYMCEVNDDSILSFHSCRDENFGFQLDNCESLAMSDNETMVLAGQQNFLIFKFHEPDKKRDEKL
ncbi:hypothetical protein B4U79_18293 [Dinothrombium tinctorium]|uniref:Uncharacterized protein n=1 Tax=Dinothrombium tinctorium TaxID=1965070 RepID=A0A443QS42_9ACAR|nr:hypothetical protein B4U79_18293 [Dinothrombium tinctorium]